MSYPKSRQPIRQLSLHADDRRKLLKTQLSEDLTQLNEYHASLPTRKQRAISDQPPPAKLAWLDNSNQKADDKNSDKPQEGIIAKKCKEIKRPATAAKLVKQTSLPKESILLSHQQLAERLRQAWKEREKSKQNLKIFLAQNVKEKLDDEPTINDVDSESMLVSEAQAFDKLANKPKIILPLKPEIAPSSEIDYKNIFQKRLRRAYSIDERAPQNAYSPTRTDFKRTVVIVPFDETKISKKPKENCVINLNLEHSDSNQIPKIHQQMEDIKIEETKQYLQEEPKISKEVTSCSVEEPVNKQIDVVIRPMTASAKREGFRSRTNSAFNGLPPKEHFRPPLVRASSVPLKPAQPKVKFLTAKRRVKSACKKKDKNEKSYKGHQSNCDDDEIQLDSSKYESTVSYAATEIVTMVSLVSPEESENEERLEVEPEKEKPKVESIIKPPVIDKQDKLLNGKHFTLRKTVSFQQSSIHAVRSFSASFPARRGSVATSLMVNNDSRNPYGNIQEKRATAENMPNDAREPKRRLLRSKSISSEPMSAGKNKEKLDVTIADNCQTPEDSFNSEFTAQPQNESELQKTEQTKENSNTESTFENAKEKQCWDAFCKMNKKGVNISFDTILRGMLTPTEYRLRRKSIACIVGETGETIENGN